MRKNTKYIYETRMEVRDYECDIQGIVNNANYLHYTEHTRHRFILSLGVSFSKLHEQGIDPVVARMNLEYKTPLTCDDEFISRLALRKDGICYIFSHDILPSKRRTFVLPRRCYARYIDKWKVGRKQGIQRGFRTFLGTRVEV